jgi:hypothetical protein
MVERRSDELRRSGDSWPDEWSRFGAADQMVEMRPDEWSRSGAADQIGEIRPDE